MKQLRDKVAEKTNVKQSSDYINDSTEHQRGYDQALQLNDAQRQKQLKMFKHSRQSQQLINN